MGAARAHLRYIQRDGVSKDLEPGRMYDSTRDEVDGAKLLERSEGDRHQFRFIVSPEDALELAELKPFVRDLMARMEHDLGTKLDWVAVDHFNTDNPHTHIVLRGKDNSGDDLVIARDYMGHGMREAASELLTLELGPITAPELRRRFERQVDQERFTDLDRALLRDAQDGVVDARPDFSGGADRLKQAVRIGRLQRLQKRGLATEVAPGRWRLADRLEETLRRSGERGDIVKTMHRGLTEVGIDAGTANYAIYDPSEPRAPTLIGRIIDRGLHNEMTDGHYVLLDAHDGRVHYVALDPKQDMDDVPVGGIVEIGPAEERAKPADRAIAAVAREHGGRYTPELHHQSNPGASVAFVNAHVRRLEALRRRDVVQRLEDGSWQIPADLEDRVARGASERRYPGRVATLSYLSLETQATSTGATWLDRQLTEPSPTVFVGERMNRLVSTARERRIENLIEQGLAAREGNSVRYHRGLLRILRKRELAAAAAKLENELGKPFAESDSEGARIDGVYKQPIRLGSGKFAVLERSKEFSLVPWRAELEPHRGRAVSAVLSGGTISFEVGRRRGLGLG